MKSVNPIGQIEFYNGIEGEVFYQVEADSPIKKLTPNDREIISLIVEWLKKWYPHAYRRLTQVCKEYKFNLITYEYHITHRFCRCNFGEYNKQSYDIDHRGRLHPEEVSCPLRGLCKDEGVICKPKIDLGLSDRQMEVIAYYVEGLDAAEIADKMFLAVATINRHRENAKARLGVKSVKDLITFWHENIQK